MAFYIGLEAWLFLFAITSWVTDGNRWVQSVFLTLIIIVTAFRFETGYDWLFYGELYEALRSPAVDVNEMFQRYLDPAFIAFTKVLTLVSADVQILYVVATVIVVLAFLHLATLIPPKLVGTFWLICINFLIFSVFFSVVRQSIALALVLSAVTLLVVKRWRIAAWALLIVAPLFHIFGAAYSAFALAGVISGKWSWNRFLLVAIGGAIAARLAWHAVPLLPDIGFFPKISTYVERGGSIDAETFFLVVLYSGLILSIARTYWKSVDIVGAFFARCAVIAALASLVMIDVEVVRNRLAYFAIPCAAIALLRAPLMIARRPSLAALATTAFVVMSLVYCGTWLLRSSAFMLVPYQNALWTDRAAAEVLRVERLRKRCDIRSQLETALGC